MLKWILSQHAKGLAQSAKKLFKAADTDRSNTLHPHEFYEYMRSQLRPELPPTTPALPPNPKDAPPVPQCDEEKSKGDDAAAAAVEAAVARAEAAAAEEDAAPPAQGQAGGSGAQPECHRQGRACTAKKICAAVWQEGKEEEEEEEEAYIKLCYDSPGLGKKFLMGTGGGRHSSI